MADTEQRGQLGLTEFVVAMHLLSSFKNGSMRALPQILPAGLYEAAARRGIPRQTTGSRQTSDATPASAIARQFSGGHQNQLRTPTASIQQPMATGDQWAITPQDKTQFDQIYSTIDTQNRGFITGEQAVGFFSNSRLPEDALAQIWDLADINSEGQLNRDEFAVAMYLIRQQRSKRDGRDVLPQSLPSNLIPPSMRRQPIAPQQPTAPAFDNAANITKPKSASEDLFGLDAFSSPASPTQAKVSHDSSTSSPTRSQTLPPQHASQQSSSQFKPFVPSSSFGQSIMTPQGTGTSSSVGSTTHNRGLAPTSHPASAMDDLLGDNDPEISKRLTNETSELANLSNQVSTLTNQMTEVKTSRSITEQNLDQAQSQKKDFEARLAQLRAAYQTEVKEVQALQERLRISQDETKRLQSEMALIEGSHQDLQNQHQQVAHALSADQTENARLKEKISQTNAEVNDLKPRLEKLKLDARQQKGLVAIYKKQLAGSENEREKARNEIDDTLAEHGQATRELEDHKKAVEAAPKAATNPASAVVSPAASAMSMNPFFRRPSNPAGTERGVNSPFTPPNVSSPNHNAFDNFFGPSAPVSTGPPPTSFGTQAPASSHEAPVAAGAVGATAGAALAPHSQGSSDEPGIPTPSASPPPSTLSDSPEATKEPPAPPQSRQITSSFLPLRPNLEREESDASSVIVVPPASRMGDRSISGVDTPSIATSDPNVPESPKQHFEEMASKAPQQPEPNPMQQVAVPPDKLSGPSVTRDVPGAFPGDDLTITDSFNPASSPYSSSVIDPRVDATPRATQGPGQVPITDPFAKLRTPTSASANDDFDSAFAGFNKGKAPETINGSMTADVVKESGPTMSNGEFPPIREFGADDESDSDEERGFDDDFTQHPANGASRSGHDEALQHKAGLSDSTGGLAPSRPPFATAGSNLSQLPTPGAETSPPPYNPSAGEGNAGHSDQRDPTQFPAEYSGLLPSREAPIPQPETLASNDNFVSNAGIDRGLNPSSNDTPKGAADHATISSQFGAAHLPMAPGASTSAPFAYTAISPPSEQQAIPPPSEKTAPKDEFDDFDDLTEAKEDDPDDDLTFSRSTNQTFDDFNPVFDSPSASRTTALGSTSSVGFPPPSESFADFTASTSGVADHGSSHGVGAPTETSSHDWDAIFAGIDGPQGSNGTQTAQERGLGLSQSQQPPPGAVQGMNGSISLTGKDDAGRSVVPPEEATDDPILKRLTGMGYPREQSLDALEKFDYNLDKVRL